MCRTGEIPATSSEAFGRLRPSALSLSRLRPYSLVRPACRRASTPASGGTPRCVRAVAAMSTWPVGSVSSSPGGVRAVGRSRNVLGDLLGNSCPPPWFRPRPLRGRSSNFDDATVLAVRERLAGLDRRHRLADVSVHPFDRRDVLGNGRVEAVLVAGLVDLLLPGRRTTAVGSSWRRCFDARPGRFDVRFDSSPLCRRGESPGRRPLLRRSAGGSGPNC